MSAFGTLKLGVGWSRGGVGAAMLSFAVADGCVVVAALRSAYPRFSVVDGCVVVSGVSIR